MNVFIGIIGLVAIAAIGHASGIAFAPTERRRRIAGFLFTGAAAVLGFVLADVIK